MSWRPDRIGAVPKKRAGFIVNVLKTPLIATVVVNRLEGSDERVEGEESDEIVLDVDATPQPFGDKPGIELVIRVVTKEPEEVEADDDGLHGVSGRRVGEVRVNLTDMHSAESEIVGGCGRVALKIGGFEASDG